MKNNEPQTQEPEEMSEELRTEPTDETGHRSAQEETETEKVDEEIGRDTEASDESLDALTKEVSTLRDRVLRQTAEFQNYRRRVEQERQSDVKFGQGMVLQQLLDVYDDLRRSVEAAEEAVQDENVDAETALTTLLGGVELVYKKFSDELQRFGIEPIEAVGAPFNEHEHEAMMQQPAPDGPEEGLVLAEIQKGYRMGDRVLRHSKVVVSG